MRGVFTALVTPFNSRKELDLDSFRRILKDQRDAGVAGVIPCGTTGESPTLTVDEKKRLIQTCLEDLKGSGVKVLAGTGSNSTAESVQFSRWASEAGVDGVLVVTPYYNKPSAAGLEAHFTSVANSVQCEVMLYNVPGRTGVSMTPATIARLSAHPKIRTIKEATGNVAFTSEILDVLAQERQKMDILSGDDATYLPLLAVGAVGVVSVASNLFPRAMVAIQRHYECGQLKEALELHRKFYPLFRDLFVESNPGPIKAAMAAAGWCKPELREPLALLSSASAGILHASLERCGVTKGSRL